MSSFTGMDDFFCLHCSEPFSHLWYNRVIVCSDDSVLVNEGEILRYRVGDINVVCPCCRIGTFSCKEGGIKNVH